MASGVQWIVFPRSRRLTPELEGVVRVFQNLHQKIDSAEHTLESNEVLGILANDLEAEGFQIERGKSKDNKVAVPVLFGINGRVEKSFFADGFHPESGIVLEVEAGRAVVNNQFLKDLFQACAMQEARHLVIAVRSKYRAAKDFEKVQTFFETLYVSNRIQLPLDSIVLIGY